MVKTILIVSMLILILVMVKIILAVVKMIRVPRVTISPKGLLPSLKRYFRENLGTPFATGFQVLLLVCAGLLIQGDPGLANEVAVYAYYLLVVGVVLQLISFVARPKEEDDES